MPATTFLCDGNRVFEPGQLLDHDRNSCGVAIERLCQRKELANLQPT